MVRVVELPEIILTCKRLVSQRFAHFATTRGVQQRTTSMLLMWQQVDPENGHMNADVSLKLLPGARSQRDCFFVQLILCVGVSVSACVGACVSVSE